MKVKIELLRQVDVATFGLPAVAPTNIELRERDGKLLVCVYQPRTPEECPDCGAGSRFDHDLVVLDPETVKLIASDLTARGII